MRAYIDPICLKILPKSFRESIPNYPKSFQIVAKMVQNRGLEGVWGCFVAWLRPDAPVGRFLDAFGAALVRFLAHLGRLLGGSWAVLGTKLGHLGAS